MDRLKGVGSLVVVTAVVLLMLRGVHVIVPAIFPTTRQAPVDVATLDDARRLTGFAPLLPAYRPASLGAGPERMRVAFGGRPTFTIVWRAGGDVLEIVQWSGGREPERPPLSQPMRDVPDSFWWNDGGTAHLVVSRGDLWVHLITSLPDSELRRFADTLTRP
jgi:hypothetical protein